MYSYGPLSLSSDVFPPPLTDCTGVISTAQLQHTAWYDTTHQLPFIEMGHLCRATAESGLRRRGGNGDRSAVCWLLASSNRRGLQPRQCWVMWVDRVLEARQPSSPVESQPRVCLSVGPLHWGFLTVPSFCFHFYCPSFSLFFQFFLQASSRACGLLGCRGFRPSQMTVMSSAVAVTFPFSQRRWPQAGGLQKHGSLGGYRRITGAAEPALPDAQITRRWMILPPISLLRGCWTQPLCIPARLAGSGGIGQATSRSSRKGTRVPVVPFATNSRFSVITFFLSS